MVAVAERPDSSTESCLEIGLPNSMTVQIPYSDVRNITTHVFRVWIRRHVENGHEAVVEADRANQCFVVTADPITIARIDYLAAMIQEKGWP